MKAETWKKKYGNVSDVLDRIASQVSSRHRVKLPFYEWVRDPWGHEREISHTHRLYEALVAHDPCASLDDVLVRNALALLVEAAHPEQEDLRGELAYAAFVGSVFDYMKTLVTVTNSMSILGDVWCTFSYAVDKDQEKRSREAHEAGKGEGGET